jgi:NAD(P)-dependent dehydrogenase (short-subunit alcohol dehydrogenase family)
MKLEQCSAVVSGGAGGLGGATSRKLAALGVKVVVFEPNLAHAKSLTDQIGPYAVPFAGDHNNEAEVQSAIVLAQSLGTFSINVNSAGIAIPTPATATLDGIPHDMGIFREMIDLHLLGPFNMSRLCAAAFACNAPDEDGQRGIIINTSSPRPRRRSRA